MLEQTKTCRGWTHCLEASVITTTNNLYAK